jgi:Spi protease inhibitor
LFIIIIIIIIASILYFKKKPLTVIKMKRFNEFCKTSLVLFVLTLFGCQNDLTQDQNDYKPKDPYSVSKSEALDIAKNLATDLSIQEFDKIKGGKSSRVNVNVREIESDIIEKSASGEAYHVINFKKSMGFVLIASDKRLQPVLAFSEKGRFDTEKVQNHYL